MVNTLGTSSNGNIYRVTVPLYGEFTGHRRIPLTKASDAELWCFLWSGPEQTLIMTSLYCKVSNATQMDFGKLLVAGNSSI